MPFSFDLLDEEQQKKKDQSQGGDQGAPAMTGGGESFGGAGPAKTDQFNADKGTSKQGSGFVNLDKYMAANQGNNFGGQVTGKVQGDVTGAKGTLEKNANDFTQASNQGTTRWNDVGDTVKGIVDQAGDNTSQDDVSKLQGYANAKYQGPESFLGSAYGTQAQGALQKGSQEANALQSEGGRFALLDQFFGRPKYSMGEKSLDNLLVQNAPGVAARAQSIGNQAKQLTGTAAQKTQELDNLATGNKFATQDTGKQTQDYLKNAESGFESDLNSRYSDYQAQNKAYNDARRSDLGDDAIDAETMKMLGLNEGQRLYDLNLSNYLRDTPEASLGQFASDKDYARYMALQQLAGEDPTLLTDRTQAGTGGSGRLTADTEALKRDLSDRDLAYQAAKEQPSIDTNSMLGMKSYNDLNTLLNTRYSDPNSAEHQWIQNMLDAFDQKANVGRKLSGA